MSNRLMSNKYFLVALVMTLVIGGLTVGNLPATPVARGVQTVDGIQFDFAEYKALDHDMLAIFNYLDTIVSSDYQGYGEWDGWFAEQYHGLHHYVLAFMAYTVAMMFEATSGYRTDHYHDFLYDLIMKMNTTFDEWGNNSIEYKEWLHPSYNYVDYWYPNNASDPEAIYTGGFRGPANIMWTAHIALMEAMYERSFNTGLMKSDLDYFVDDWNISLTSDRRGNPKEGGLWGTGLIPCEPYIVFVQCNSIPMLCTRLYDNLYATQYWEGGMWDYGLNFMNTVAQDKYSLFIDGYYVDRPTSSLYDTSRVPDEIPGPQQSLYADDGSPKVSSYCNGWALAFLQYIQPEASAADYPVFLEYFMKDVSADSAYIMDTYNNPGGFGTFDILGTLFTMHLANQMGDYVTRDRLANFFFNSYNKVWSPDGRQLHFDTMSLEPFLQSVAAFGWIWAHTPVTVMDLGDARPAEFWDYPYISSADDDRIWVYQAEWDAARNAFILNVRVDQSATLSFTNFASAPTAYSSGSVLGVLTASGTDYDLSLEPGAYQLVIK